MDRRERRARGSDLGRQPSEKEPLKVSHLAGVWRGGMSGGQAVALPCLGNRRTRCEGGPVPGCIRTPPARSRPPQQPCSLLSPLQVPSPAGAQPLPLAHTALLTCPAPTRPAHTNLLCSASNARPPGPQLLTPAGRLLRLAQQACGQAGGRCGGRQALGLSTPGSSFVCLVRPPGSAARGGASSLHSACLPCCPARFPVKPPGSHEGSPGRGSGRPGPSEPGHRAGECRFDLQTSNTPAQAPKTHLPSATIIRLAQASPSAQGLGLAALP